MEYFDIDGNQTTLEKLVTEQPAWACSRIRADRERIEKLEGERESFAVVLARKEGEAVQFAKEISRLREELSDQDAIIKTHEQTIR